MSQTIRAGIIGAGWPGGQHAKGYTEAGGFKIVAVADLIPARRERMIAEYGQMKQYADANELIKDRDIDVVSVCLPNFLHAPVTVAKVLWHFIAKLIFPRAVPAEAMVGAVAVLSWKPITI